MSISDQTQERSIKTPGDLQTTYVWSDISRNLIQRVSKFYAMSSKLCRQSSRKLEMYSSVQGSFLSFSSLIRRRFFMHSRYFLSVDQSHLPLGVFMQIPWSAWQSGRDGSELRLVPQRQASLISFSLAQCLHHGQLIT